MILLLVVVTSASCKQRVSDDDNAFVLARLVEYRDRMCACRDSPCAESVQAALSRWSAELGDKAASPTQAQAKQLAELATAYGECLTKILVPPADASVDSLLR